MDYLNSRGYLKLTCDDFYSMLGIQTHMDFILNIMGSEWMIIIFVAIVLILGTNKLPDAAKKLGKAVNEYNKAKNDVQDQVKSITSTADLKVDGPVKNEREKLESIAKALSVDTKDKTDDELRKIISSKMEQNTPEPSKK